MWYIHVLCIFVFIHLFQYIHIFTHNIHISHWRKVFMMPTDKECLQENRWVVAITLNAARYHLSVCYFWVHFYNFVICVFEKYYNSLSLHHVNEQGFECYWRKAAMLIFPLSLLPYNFYLTFHQAQVDTMRVSKALNAIGEKLQCLSFLPTENLHNIVTFQNCITRYGCFLMWWRWGCFDYLWVIMVDHEIPKMMILWFFICLSTKI